MYLQISSDGLDVCPFIAVEQEVKFCGIIKISETDGW